MIRLLRPITLIAVCAVFALALAQAPEAEAQKGGGKGKKAPNIQQTITAMEKTHKDLAAAPHDFGGHKAKAMHDLEVAIHQLKLAVQFAEKGTGKDKKGKDKKGKDKKGKGKK